MYMNAHAGVSCMPDYICLPARLPVCLYPLYVYIIPYDCQCRPMPVCPCASCRVCDYERLGDSLDVSMPKCFCPSSLVDMCLCIPLCLYTLMGACPYSPLQVCMPSCLPICMIVCLPECGDASCVLLLCQGLWVCGCVDVWFVPM